MATKAKRETKAEKEVREKSALRAKFLDIAAGACGEVIRAEDGFVELHGGPEALGRFAGALASIYQGEPIENGKVGEWMFRINRIADFDDLDGLVERFHALGVRA